MQSRLATAFLRWTFVRAAFARGYWLTTALYLVVVADLTPAQLVLIGVFQGITVVIAEVPAGVLADAVSRRLSLVIGHVVMGAGMAMAGLVTAFPLLVVSQCLWGLGWAFSSGADVAWLTDELDRPDLIDRVLVARARWDLFGSQIGIVVCAAVAWASSLSTAIVAAGVAMMVLGVVTVARWPESGFVPAAAGRRWRQSMSIFRRGVALARFDRVIAVVIVATLLVNGGGEAYGRLLEQRLVALGMPTHPNPIVWFAAVAFVGVVFGAVVLRIVEAHHRRRSRQAHVRVVVRRRCRGSPRVRERSRRRLRRRRHSPRLRHRLPGDPRRRWHLGEPPRDQRGARHRALDALAGRKRRRGDLRPRPGGGRRSRIDDGGTDRIRRAARRRGRARARDA